MMNSLETSPSPLIRKAFVMAVSPGKSEEYARRHNPIWPELEALLRKHGVRSYSIFYYSSTSQLFGYVEIESEVLWDSIAVDSVCQRWWEHMSDIMPCHPDHRPLSADLAEVFHLG